MRTEKDSEKQDTMYSSIKTTVIQVTKENESLKAKTYLLETENSRLKTQLDSFLNVKKESRTTMTSMSGFQVRLRHTQHEFVCSTPLELHIDHETWLLDHFVVVVVVVVVVAVIIINIIIVVVVVVVINIVVVVVVVVAVAVAVAVIVVQTHLNLTWPICFKHFRARETTFTLCTGILGYGSLRCR